MSVAAGTITVAAEGLLIDVDFVESVVDDILAESAITGALVESGTDGILAESVVTGILRESIFAEVLTESVVSGFVLVEDDFVSTVDEELSAFGVGLSVAL